MKYFYVDDEYSGISMAAPSKTVLVNILKMHGEYSETTTVEEESASDFWGEMKSDYPHCVGPYRKFLKVHGCIITSLQDGKMLLLNGKKIEMWKSMEV